ncbi:gfo/Idh/MocA family oxidoreductase [Pontibacillus yanchengensis]|uniref:Gfo/Idh/MocA family oxidoreductase n=2 Tax=Pontibacillus yanchengensis TaxID=462910 RepID=A0ACC7VG62_9BACI|nr:Gfo/Idh/MocA family oxidoreductase [Pontibacillus yanchengensis]MYL33891.1 gfo/Idh/MocA family oxidoreductase [Pontibacillus yanchengensis]MYL53916.1 gfo/Idh/MocA family oxidoreductase [Pontibacillus yanchengensis]
MKKIAVIGAGAMAEVGHFPHYQSHPDTVVSCIVDQREDRARWMAERFQVPSFYTDVETMLANEEIDGASICTPNSTHLPIAQKLLENGIHILMEKPIGTNVEEARKVVEFARHKKLVCMVGMTQRFRTEAMILKRLIEHGRLGTIYHVRAQYLRRRGTPQGWFTNEALAGGGTMMDIGVHALDLAWWLIGAPTVKSVTGTLKDGIGNYHTLFLKGGWNSAVAGSAKPMSVEDFGSGYFRFEGGVTLNVEASWAINGQETDGLCIDIYGKEGGASLQPLCIYHELDGIYVESTPVFSKNDVLQEEIYHFIECMLHGKEPVSSGQEGVEVLRMLDGLAHSSQRGTEYTF